MNAKVKKNIIFISVVSTFITSFMGSALNLSAPDMGEEFGLSASQTGWIVTAYMLTCTSLAVVFGRLADVMDRKKILVIGLGIFTAGSLGGSLAPSTGLLLTARLLQGTGTAMIYSTSMSILVMAADDSDRGKMLGISTAATYVGLSAGPVLGGFLNCNLGWRAIFALTAAVSAIAFFCAFRHLPGRKETGFPGKIYPSARSCIIYVLSLSGMILGMSAAGTWLWGWAVFAAGAAGLVYYGVNEGQKSSTAVLPVKLFARRPAFGWSGAASMLNYGTNFVVNYYLSIYLQSVKGLSSQTAGILLIASPLVQSLLSPLTGKLSDRLSPHRLSAAGMAGTAAVAAAFGMLKEDTAIWLIIAGLGVAGAACACFASPNTNIVMSAAGKAYYGIASSVLSTLRSMGHSVSMAAAGIISGIFIGSGSLADASSQQVLQSMQITFFLFSGLCILGIFMALKKNL